MKKPNYIKKIFFKTAIPTLIILSLFSWAISSKSAEIAPEKSIKIVNKVSHDPEWKKLWDTARESVRQQKYNNAIILYKKILNQKPNIEEVKWELCKVLISTNQYQDASLLIDSLLEIDNNRVEYLITAGDIALLNAKKNQAALYYGQALEFDPTGKFSISALQGFIRALKEQGKKKKALPLMEQLYMRGEVTPELLNDIAGFLKDIGELKKSSYYYHELVEKYRVTPEILYEAASVLEESGNLEEAVKTWEKYLELNPDLLEFQIKAADYYLSVNNYEKALPHLNVLLDNGINREKYLLEVGKINLFILGRADKALAYYENYQKEFPEGIDVSKNISNIQLILANDFLSIVENDGVWMLWRDLAKVTPDRIGIYRAMADLLEEIGKEKEFVEVLQIINLHEPTDKDIKYKLSELYLKNKYYDKCLLTLGDSPAESSTLIDHLLLKAECERGANKDLDLLNTLESYLEVKPSDLSVRLKAIKLAGNLGQIEILKILSKKTTKNKVLKKSDVIIIDTFLDGLIKNHLLYEAEKMLDKFLETKKLDLSARIMLVKKKGIIFEMQGKMYEAEQKFRENAAQNPDSLNAILDLAAHSILENDTRSSSIWVSLAKKKISYEEGEKDLSEQKSRLAEYQIKYIELTKGKSEAETKATSYLMKKKKSGKFAENDFQIVLFLVEQRYKDEKFSRCKILLESYKKYFNSRSDFKAVLTLINEKFKPKDRIEKYSSYSITELFELYEILVKFEDLDQVGLILKKISGKKKNLFRTKVLVADFYLKTFKYKSAQKLYKELLKIYPDEKYFKNKIYETNYLSGSIDEFLEFKKEKSDGHTLQTEIVDYAKSISSPSIRRQIARSMWTIGRWDEALQIYSDLELLLENKISDVLNQIKINNHSNDGFLENNSLWKVLNSSLDDSEILVRVMDVLYFSENLGDKTALITSGSYASFKWLNIIKKEHEAKKSLNDKKFYQAEKEYQELIKDDDFGDDIYPDLATIYSRLGRYAKETEMIERIKETKNFYPGMQPFVEQNKLQRQPQIYLDSIYLDEEGRNGSKDITKWYNGLGIRLQPSIFQEFGFRVGWADYGNSITSSLSESFSIGGEYSVFFNDFIEARLNVGMEELEQDDKSRMIYDFTMKGRLEEFVEIHAGIRQERVTDTIESLEAGIYRKGYVAGLTIDYLPSVFMGFDFDIINYNDSNNGKRFKVWSSYRIFSDTSRFDFSYNYEKIENDYENNDLSSFAEGLDCEPLYYWSPGNYWRHIVSLEYRRELWPTGKFYSGTSYFSAKYGIGYESYENLVQLLELNIFLEINPMFLLKGTFISDWTEGYDRNEGYASFVYRW